MCAKLLALFQRLSGKPHGGIGELRQTTPERAGTNFFLVSFCESGLLSIEVSEERIRLCSPAFFEHLNGLDYARIRNRFRVMGNLDPVRNKVEDKGIIQISYLVDGVVKNAEIEAVFPPSGERFYLNHRPRVANG